jgi:hypothetical protein
MEPIRVSNLTVDQFLHEFVAPAKPCIITDGMRGWPGAEFWSPKYFREDLGDLLAQIYNDRFDLVNVTTLAEYMDEYFYTPNTGLDVPYVRWYTKLKDVDFIWGDEAFERIKGQWSNPYFLPDTGLLLPFCMEPNTISPVDTRFPARSFFVSGPGAATRMHWDPWGSESILFQIHGLKKWVMYSQEQHVHLRRDDGAYVDLAKPDLTLFPTFPQAKPTCEFYLKGGETIYVPRGWIHEVETVEGSISLTWNFVHRIAMNYYLDYLATNEPTGHHLEVLRFFYRGLVPEDATAADIADFVKRNTIYPDATPEKT